VAILTIDMYNVQAHFAGISYVVYGSWDLGKPLSSPTQEK